MTESTDIYDAIFNAPTLENGFEAEPEQPATRKRGRRPGDGRGRLGGRAKGTGNRPQQPAAEWIHDLVEKHRGYIERQLIAPWTPEGNQILCTLILADAILNGQNGPFSTNMNNITTNIKNSEK